jgi:hypothetical protein
MDHNNSQQSSAQPPADTSMEDLVAQMSGVQVSNGPQHRTQQDVDLLATILALRADALDSSLSGVYLAALDDAYKYVTTYHQHVERNVIRLGLFLGGIQDSFPVLYARHCNTILDVSFRWDAFFRDMAYDAMTGPFGAHPAAQVLAVLLRSEATQAFLRGKTYVQLWESALRFQPQDETMRE